MGSSEVLWLCHFDIFLLNDNLNMDSTDNFICPSIQNKLMSKWRLGSSESNGYGRFRFLLHGFQFLQSGLKIPLVILQYDRNHTYNGDLHLDLMFPNEYLCPSDLQTNTLNLCLGGAITEKNTTKLQQWQALLRLCYNDSS
eukprot:Gb_17907 [translate_table: standard]